MSNELINFPLYFLGLMKQTVFCINELKEIYVIDLSNFISPEDIIPFIYHIFII